jgi:nickel superoxide dismutase
MLLEDITTVEKSMQQVVELSKDPAANANQLVRWVNNKEQHCDKIQHVVTQYFMTQRIKPAPDSDAAAYKAYTAKLAKLHGILVHAMKAKQTTDATHVEALRKLVDEFAGLYFDKEDLKHLREHHE